MKLSKTGLLAVVALAAACDSSTGPDGGDATIFMARTSATASAELGSNSTADYVNSAGPITLAMVDSVMVRVTAVEVARAGADTASGSAWTRLALEGEGGKRINLLALPREGTDSVKIARGDLAAGTYNHIRLIVDDSDARITLNQDVVAGVTSRITKGSYALRLPSAAQSGLKLQTGSFTVSEDVSAGVTLVFDAASSIGNISVTGNGQFTMSPVLRSRK